MLRVDLAFAELDGHFRRLLEELFGVLAHVLADIQPFAAAPARGRPPAAAPHGLEGLKALPKVPEELVEEAPTEAEEGLQGREHPLLAAQAAVVLLAQVEGLSSSVSGDHHARRSRAHAADVAERSLGHGFPLWMKDKFR